MDDKTGLSLIYRIAWRLEFLGVSVFGPAQRMPENDPKRRLRRQRAEKVLAAHESRGTQPSQEVLDVISSGGDDPKLVAARARRAQRQAQSG